MSHDNDDIRRARDGDREAFGELVRRYHRRVYATAFRVVGNHSDADDLTQEAFLRAFRALPTFDGRSDFFTWLYRIVVNLALNLLRQQQRHRATPLDDGRLPAGWDRGGTDLRSQAEAKDLVARVGEVLGTLSPTLRITVVLALIEEMPHKIVAEILGCSEGTVAWRVNQARKQLRQRLRAAADGRAGAAGPVPGDDTAAEPRTAAAAPAGGAVKTRIAALGRGLGSFVARCRLALGLGVGLVSEEG
ncbi:MAG TPA: sigma-70 family RNA polymerase sigma factor [Polyangia bacterium]|jgi:RNA polymerase sigma-70 factor (ECF subfamily)